MISTSKEESRRSASAGLRRKRAHLIRHLRERGIRDLRVLRAMGRVPREMFVPDEERVMAYADQPLPIGEGQTISQPYIVAVMLEALELEGSERVLEVGAGSGYAAALLSSMGARVYAIERLPRLVEGAKRSLERAGIADVSLACGDGRLGWPEAQPFDGVLVSAAAPDVPQALLDQLSIGGRLVAPVGAQDRRQMLLRIRRLSKQQYEREEICPVHFVPLLSGAGSTE